MACTAPPLAGVLETSLYVADMVRARRFYEVALGLVPMFADERLTAYPVGPRSALLLFLRGSTAATVDLPGGATLYLGDCRGRPARLGSPPRRRRHPHRGADGLAAGQHQPVFPGPRRASARTDNTWAVAGLVASCPARHRCYTPGMSTSNQRIDGRRLWDSLMAMAEIGATPKGGVRRLTLTEVDKAGRERFRAWCEAAGLTVRVDAIGNMFARRPGRDPSRPPVLLGSHLDSQPSGGKFDGALGVIAGLEVMRSLNDLGIETEAPIELVNWGDRRTGAARHRLSGGAPGAAFPRRCLF